MKCVGAENGPPCKRCETGGHEVSLRRSSSSNNLWISSQHFRSVSLRKATGENVQRSKFCGSANVSRAEAADGSPYVQEVRSSPAIVEQDGKDTRHRSPVIGEPSFTSCSGRWLSHTITRSRITWLGEGYCQLNVTVPFGPAHPRDLDATPHWNSKWRRSAFSHTGFIRSAAIH